MNILYITVDALRADHVSEDVMPTARSFVDDAIEFTNCFANGPGTPWSFPSLLSSRYAGATDGFGIPPAGDGHPTLAEVLQQEEYATAGFTDNRFASSDYNYDRGIELMYDSGATSKVKRLKQAVRNNIDYDSILYQGLLRSYHLIDDFLVSASGRNSRFVRGEVLVDQLLNWVDEQDDSWFAWLHPMDVHAPYEAPAKYQNQYFEKPLDRRESQNLARKAVHHPEELDESDWEKQRKLYKAECKYLDDQLGRLFDSLGPDVFDETVIILTADHGDMHGEHGQGGHPQAFWEEIIHVPCGVSIPETNPATIEEQVGLIDLPPSILDSVGISPPDVWDGETRLPTNQGHVEARVHQFIDVGAELNYNHAGIRRADSWKLMRHQDEEFLFDLSSNPSERPTENQAETNPEQYDQLSEVLDRHLSEMQQRRAGEATGVEDDEMIEEHLKQLGYLE